MDYNSHRNPPPAPSAPAVPATPDRAHWTPGKQRIFLAALMETGSVTTAARAAGMNRSSAQRLRLRLAGTPFDRAWTQVLQLHADRLADPLGPTPAASPPLPGRGAAATEPRW